MWRASASPSISRPERVAARATASASISVSLMRKRNRKEAETDARKRALMTFGNPFGLALYDKTQANVADEVDAARGSVC